MKRTAGALLAVFALAAAAQGGDFRVVVPDTDGDAHEVAAVQGAAIATQTARHVRLVGAAGRAFSLSANPAVSIWGLLAEAMNFPGASGHVIGLEVGAVNMAHANAGEIRGLDVVFKNRMDTAVSVGVPLGENRYNDRSAAVYISAQPRSPSGEYAGWQTALKLGPASLDRSASVPYAAAIDVSELEVAVPFYVVVWRCGQVKCGLVAGDRGLTVVEDIESRR